MRRFGKIRPIRPTLGTGQDQVIRKRFFRQLQGNVPLILGLAGFLLFVATSVFAGQLAPYPLDKMELRNQLLPPSIKSGFVLGTDNLGRDVLTRMLYAIRISLLVAGSATAISSILGGLLGIMAGFVGGWFDSVVMRLVDIQLSVPTFFLALAGVVVIGQSVGGLILILITVGWARFARIARGSTLTIREEPYIEAVRSLGAGPWRIIRGHVLPNILAPLLVLLSVTLPTTIMVEAALSFVGMGLPVGTPSLGGMVKEGYPYMLSGAWWVAILPGFVLILLVLSINTVADSLRDMADVRI